MSAQRRLTLGLALIARDGQASLPGLLASVEHGFDQIVLVDTGSADATVEVFERWSDSEARRNPRFSSCVAKFAWRDDFGAARTFADSLLRTDWNVWADADDQIRGALELRSLAERAPSRVAGFKAGYRCAENGTGQALAYVNRIRVTRAGAGKWEGRVHETLAVDGVVAHISPSDVEWVHRGASAGATPESLARNIAILQSWLQAEPDNPRVLLLLGDGYLATKRNPEALCAYRRYLELRPDWCPSRARVHRQIAIALMALGRHREALEHGHQALLAVPRWSESHLTIAEAHLALGEPAPALHWARLVLGLGPPKTDMVIKPLDFSLRPRMLIASALRQMGDEAASRAAGEAILASCFAAD